MSQPATWRRGGGGAELSQDGSAWRWWSVIEWVCSAALERSPKRRPRKAAGRTAPLNCLPGRCRHRRRSALDGSCYSLLQSVHQVGCGEGGARQMHSGLPSADATVTRCSPQRATARPFPLRCAHGSPPERLRLGSFAQLSPFHAAQTHPAEAPQVKDECAAGLLGGGGVGFCQRPCKTVDRPGGRAPRLPWLAEWSMGPACQSLAKIWSCCAASCASDEAASEPTGGVKARVVAASVPPIGPPRHHQCAPHLHSTTNVPNGKSWSCSALQDMCVCVCVGVRGGLGLPGGGLEEWRTRAWPFACARAAGRRVAGQRTRGEDGRGCAAREPHKQKTWAASAPRYTENL